MTNAEFAKADKKFIEACEAAGIKSTRRQASKFLMGMGLAYKHMKSYAASSPKRIGKHN